MAVRPQKKQNNKKPKTKKSRGNGRINMGSKSASVAAAYSTAAMGKSPTIRATRDSCVVQHRELISSVVGSSDFQVTKFSINPGLPETFPWLSVIAQAWEKYRFRYLRFVYLSRTGTTTIGQILIAPDYDAADDNPSTEQILSTYQDAIADAPWKGICCHLKAGSMSNSLGRFHFNRFANLAANLDIKTYDVANIYIATTDGVDDTPWGKLWVEYEVEFQTPQLPPTGISVNGGEVEGNGAMTGALPFGDNPIVNPNSRGFIMETDDANQVIMKAPGTYMCVFAIAGTDISVLTVTLTNGAVAVDTSVVINAVGTEANRNVTFITSVGGTLTFAVTAGTVTASAFDLGQGPASSYA